MNSDRFACGCDIAWLIQDNRHLLPVVRDGKCADNSPFPSVAFSKLDPNSFPKCSSTPSSTPTTTSTTTPPTIPKTTPTTTAPTTHMSAPQNIISVVRPSIIGFPIGFVDGRNSIFFNTFILNIYLTFSYQFRSLACGCDIAWLIRDNRHLLPAAIRDGKCARDSPFLSVGLEELDPRFCTFFP